MCQSPNVGVSAVSSCVNTLPKNSFRVLAVSISSIVYESITLCRIANTPLVTLVLLSFLYLTLYFIAVDIACSAVSLLCHLLPLLVSVFFFVRRCSILVSSVLRNGTFSTYIHSTPLTKQVYIHMWMNF